MIETISMILIILSMIFASVAETLKEEERPVGSMFAEKILHGKATPETFLKSIKYSKQIEISCSTLSIVCLVIGVILIWVS